MPRDAMNLSANPSAQPYSDAVWLGDQLCLSGRIAIGGDGQLICGDIAEQTRTALGNIGRVLGLAELTLDDVVKTTVYLVDMGDYAAMNAAYVAEFADPLPARSCVAVRGLPLGALVEIEVIARRRCG